MAIFLVDEGIVDGWLRWHDSEWAEHAPATRRPSNFKAIVSPWLLLSAQIFTSDAQVIIPTIVIIHAAAPLIHLIKSHLLLLRVGGISLSLPSPSSCIAHRRQHCTCHIEPFSLSLAAQCSLWWILTRVG